MYEPSPRNRNTPITASGSHWVRDGSGFWKLLTIGTTSIAMIRSPAATTTIPATASPNAHQYGRTYSSNRRYRRSPVIGLSAGRDGPAAQRAVRRTRRRWGGSHPGVPACLSRSETASQRRVAPAFQEGSQYISGGGRHWRPAASRSEYRSTSRDVIAADVSG